MSDTEANRDSASQPLGIILLYHGSAEEEWARAAQWLCAMVARSQPGAVVRTACVKDFHPSMDDAAGSLQSAGVTRALVAPIFIAPGGHVARDFPKIAEDLKKRWPGMEFIWTDVAGTWEEVGQAVVSGIGARMGRLKSRD